MAADGFLFGIVGAASAKIQRIQILVFVIREWDFCIIHADGEYRKHVDQYVSDEEVRNGVVFHGDCIQKIENLVQCCLGKTEFAGAECFFKGGNMSVGVLKAVACQGVTVIAAPADDGLFI